MSEENAAPKNKTHMWARRKARRALAQAAYQWQVSQTEVLQLRREFGEKALDKADAEFFADILTLMVRHCQTLDAQLEHCWIVLRRSWIWWNAAFLGSLPRN